MPKVTLVKNDAVTSDVVADLLKQRFPQHEVYPTKLVGSDYVIKLDALKGAAIKVKQKDDKTVVVVNGIIPSTGLRILLVVLGVIPFVIAQTFATKEVVEHVRGTIQSAPELQPGGAQPALSGATA